MRVLFIASNPEERDTLNLEREITELQSRAANSEGEEVSFIFLPKLPIEELSAEIARHEPDVLHISAHADPKFLSLANAAGRPTAITSRALASFLPSNRPPSVIYLSGCNSEEIAAALVPLVPIAIGTNAPITNRAARAGAAIFYEKLLAGETIERAFHANREMVRAIDDQTVESVMFVRDGVVSSEMVLKRVPRLIAKLVAGGASQEYCDVVFGLAGCPASTVQIIFFTDDISFEIGVDSLEHDLCELVRDTPIRSVVWMPDRKAWEVYGDFRLFAVGVTGDASTFSVASTLCEALEAAMKLSGKAVLPKGLAKAIAWLRTRDGGNLLGNDSAWEPKAASRSKAEALRAKKKK